jgi:signal transduction histidine kinase
LLLLVGAVSGLTVPGWLLARRRQGNRVSAVLLALPLILSGQYVMHSWELIAGRHGWPGVQLVSWATTWWFLLLAGGLVALLLRLPGGEPLSSRWLRYERIVFGHVALVVVLFALAPRLPGTDPSYPPNPWGLAALAPLAPVSLVLYALVAVHLVVGLAAVVLRFRRGTPVERQQLRWIGGGAAVLVAAVLVVTLAGAPTAVMALGTAALVGSIAVAVLRYRLWDLGLVVRRTLVYLVLTAFLVAAYVGLVLGLRSVVHVALVPELLVTAVIAIVALPLREVLQRAIDRMLFGERRDPYLVVRALGRRLEDGADPVLPSTVRGLAEALRLPGAAIVLPDGTVAAAHGTVRGDGARIPLQHNGHLVGELLAARRHPAEPLTGLDLRLLTDVAGHLGVIVQAALLDEAVRRSQERLVQAREAERARLRRDLHDEMGPVLGAASLRVAAARNLLGSTEPPLEQVGTVLSAVAGDLDRARAEVQRIVTHLRPGVLAAGLLDALREHASGWTGTLQLDLRMPAEVPPLAEAVEVAAYRIAVEGLHNAERHSGGTTATVAVAVRGQDLEVVVEDDGCGLSAPPSRGVGLGSMRERARMAGGILRLEPGMAGGLRVYALLPLAAP